ncbi:regulatory protein RecX [Corynebacterium choanae]|uniref:Regulatory protein RecX n=1 Tax=Corynebacterium choanae TaxID=1862358 RepID=A0A3G6JC91_9CORY|nr:regulatory protein RecX [Corynebacterium choanae]AZA13784.1 Regulatory protein RecX [Corynebacterium choanae]
MDAHHKSRKQDIVAKLSAAIAQIDEQPSFSAERVVEQHKAPVKQRALAILNARARSRYELQQRLIAAEFPPELVELVLDDFAQAGLLDDAAFANEWVRQRHERRGKSRSVLDQELREKGVASAIRAAALAQIDDDDERSIAEQLARKKARAITGKPVDFAEYQKLLRRIVGVLARRGFPSGVAMSVAKDALEQRLAELDT